MSANNKKGHSFFDRKEIRNITGYDKEYFNAPVRTEKSNSHTKRFEKGRGAHGSDIFYYNGALYDSYEKRTIGLSVGLYDEDNNVVDVKHYLFNTKDERRDYIMEKITEEYKTLIQVVY